MWVRVWCGDGGGGGPAAAPDIIGIVADANRDGVVDEKTDQERENEWDMKVGASFIANLDDDDMDGKRDCEDEVINGPADLADLALFRVSAWPTAAADAEGVVSIDPEAAESVRIFRDNPCLLYTSDAADERTSVDIGGRPIIKKKKTTNTNTTVRQ